MVEPYQRKRQYKQRNENLLDNESYQRIGSVTELSGKKNINYFTIYNPIYLQSKDFSFNDHFLLVDNIK